MELERRDLKFICEEAIRAATEAGRLIQQYRYINVKTKHKTNQNSPHPVIGSSEASQIVTEVDKKSQEVILRRLSEVTKNYDFGILTEESKDDYSRFNKEYFWCIDPLDGTLPFINRNRGYSVSIALVNKSGKALIGVVYDPVADNVYYAAHNMGAHKNEEHFILKPKKTIFTWIMDKSFKKHPAYLDFRKSIKLLGQSKGYPEFTPIAQGGAVMNAIWAIENTPSCYFKLPKTEIGGGSVWDFAATSCILEELNQTVCTFNGNPIQLNPTDSTFMNEEGIFYGVNVKLEEVQHAIEKLLLVNC